MVHHDRFGNTSARQLQHFENERLQVGPRIGVEPRSNIHKKVWVSSVPSHYVLMLKFGSGLGKDITLNCN